MPRTRPEPGSLPAVLGCLLQEKRLERGLSVPDLAALTGLSVGVIRRYEFGDRMPSWEAFITIARKLDMTPSQLMSYLDDFGLEKKPGRKRRAA